MTTEGLRERKKVETARRLASCAYALARRRGIDEVTTDDIAHAAGYSRRTVANYFDGKAQAVVDGFFLEIGHPGRRLRHAQTTTQRPAARTVEDLIDATEVALHQVLRGSFLTDLHDFARLVHGSVELRPHLIATLRDMLLDTFDPEDAATQEKAELLLGATVGLVTVLLERLLEPGTACATGGARDTAARTLDTDDLDQLLTRGFGYLRAGFTSHSSVLTPTTR